MKPQPDLETNTRPICYDLYYGLGGWAEDFLSEGFRCIGYDIEKRDYGTGTYPGELILADVHSIHGSQLADAACIVASPPCQEPSYRAMPWKRAKALNAIGPPHNFIELFNACFRIQREASEAAGRYIPLIVENVVGAQLMPTTIAAQHRVSKNNGGSWFNVAHNTTSGKGQNPDGRKLGVAAYQPGAEIPEGTGKTSWFFGNTKHELRGTSSGSKKRKAASAEIAKIPFPLAQHIARCFKPVSPRLCASEASA